MSVEEKLERLLDQNVFTASWSADAKRLMVGWVTNIFDESRPHGEWIEHRQFSTVGYFYSEYECSNCHDEVWQKTEWQFCPNCGADMREGEANDATSDNR